MTGARLSAVALLSCLLSGASAGVLGQQGGATLPQAKPAAPTATSQAKPAAPALEQPADFKAFNEAAKIADPAKRAEALEKFVADYPDSVLMGSAESEIASASLRTLTAATRRYLAIQEKRQDEDQVQGDLTVSGTSMPLRVVLQAATVKITTQPSGRKTN
jgi:hypothetical protein